MQILYHIYIPYLHTYIVNIFKIKNYPLTLKYEPLTHKHTNTQTELSITVQFGL